MSQPDEIVRLHNPKASPNASKIELYPDKPDPLGLTLSPACVEIGVDAGPALLGS